MTQETFNAEKGVYDNSGFAHRLRKTVGDVNDLVRKAPAGVIITFDTLDFSTTRGEQEQLQVEVTQRI
jgi:hypothetical protein